ncbi:MarR family transcriptional regulator [bacterium]|nr:MarR family transcriptional regulator [bacterium]
MDQMNQQFENNVKNIVWALRRIVSLIYHDSRNMMKKYGITGPQSLVIKSLCEASGPLSPVKLSRQLNVTPANITGIIDRLEEKGLVQRNRQLVDRRAIQIELTEDGYEFGKNLPDLIEEKLIRGLKDLKPTEVYGIYSALNTIIKIIGAEEVPPTPLD